MKGLFNPYTTGGTIIVDRVVASVHTRWFLDALFDRLGVAHLLPSAYEFILSPARVLYAIMGKNLYTDLYQRLDARIDIPTAGMNHGGAFVASSVLAFAAASSALLLSLRRFNK
jgi:hypothetical protein